MTPVMMLLPKMASSWGTRDQVVPSTEVHTAPAAGSDQLIPTATRPGPPAVTLVINCQSDPVEADVS